MTKPSAADHFNAEAARLYDERNRSLAPIGDCMHFLIQLALRELPAESSALCVGVGTGSEVLRLAKAFPQWTFVGIDPSSAMLEVCRERLVEAGIEDRCQLVHGFVEDAPLLSFDVALSVLVAHFVPKPERLDFFCNMTRRLKPGGYLVNTEISFDLESREFPHMLENWQAVQRLMGATAESLAKLPIVLREMLAILKPQDTEEVLRQSGVVMPVHFFQAFMIGGWWGRVT